MSLRFDRADADADVILTTDRTRASLAQHGWLDAIPALATVARDPDGFIRVSVGGANLEGLDHLVEALTNIDRPAAAELEALL